MARKTLWLFIMVCAFWPSASLSARPFPKTYDREIKRAADIWLPGVDWRLWKAQLWQESRLDQCAVSPVGARGLAQFMPATWGEVSKAMGYGALDPHSAAPSIHAGAYYMARLSKQWSSPRPWADRHSLALASYNAGLGNLLKSQKLCGGRVLYAEIAACLPQVTGRHAAETLEYVPATWRWWVLMMVE